MVRFCNRFLLKNVDLVRKKCYHMHMEVIKILNDRIAEVRKENNLTQEKFANRIGLTRNFVWMIEKGERIPSDRTIADICREFDVNEKWLRTGEGEPFKQLARKEAIARFAGELMKDEEDSFRIKLVELLAELDESEWAMLERFVDKLTKKADQD